MELTWTDVVFSRIALVLFLCRNQSSQNVLKISGNIFGKYEKYLRKDPPEGVGQWATSPVAAATPLAGATKLVGPTWLCHPHTHVYKFTFVLEKIKIEDLVAFAIRRRRHHLFFIWRADLESVLGSGEGKSSSSTFFPLQFHEALRRS